MKKYLFIVILLLTAINMQAQNKQVQSISYIETTKSWYYIYDQNGRKVKGLSTNIGELKGFSAAIFVVKNGSWYYVYNAKGDKIKGLSAYNIGDVLSVAGETFTSRKGFWIYTWDKNGKVISTRAAQH